MRGRRKETLKSVDYQGETWLGHHSKTWLGHHSKTWLGHLLPLSSCHLEALVHGNLTRDEAVALCATARAALGPGCAAPPSVRQRDQCVSLPHGVEVISR